jgi:ubiquinone/menaquinone biosynthesis C-methylase UbiE
LINAAEERNQTTDGNLHFRIGDASNLESVKDESFDIAISMMCLMAIVTLDEAVKEMARVLKQKGRVVLSSLHPCFTGPYARVIQNGKEQQFTNDHYFNEEWFEEGLSKALQTSLPFHHRTMESLITTFIDSGFILRKIIEPNPSDELLAKFPGMAPLRRIPQFIILDFQKGA